MLDIHLGHLDEHVYLFNPLLHQVMWSHLWFNIRKFTFFPPTKGSLFEMIILTGRYGEVCSLISHVSGEVTFTKIIFMLKPSRRVVKSVVACGWKKRSGFGKLLTAVQGDLCLLFSVGGKGRMSTLIISCSSPTFGGDAVQCKWQVAMRNECIDDTSQYWE